jgi:hypothetical protein
MTAQTQNQAPEQSQEPQKAQSDKEINFARVRKQLEEANARAERAEQVAAEAQRSIQERSEPQQEEEDSYDEPYVSPKFLNKRLSHIEKNIEEKIDKKAEEKAEKKLEEFKAQQWLRQNPDFNEVMDQAQKLQDKDPELADIILSFPNNFERQKLVYKHIKATGMHLKEAPKASIQETVDKNKRSPYYQPGDVASAPYAGGANFTDTGMKAGYAKMQELINRRRAF